MGRRRHGIETEIEWIFHGTARDHACDVRDIHHCICAYLARYVYEFFVVEFSRIRRVASQHDFRFFTLRDLTHLVIINFACLNIFHFVADEIKYFCEVGDGMSVRQVAAVR